MRKSLIFLILFLSVSSTVLSAEPRKAYDVVVIGATPAGIAAALTAGRAGLRVVLVEETPVPGGLLSNGVSRADDAMVESVSGVFEEFRRRVANYYLTKFPNDPVVVAHRTKPRVRHSVAKGQAWEAKVAADIYRAMLAEVKSIETFYQEVPVSALVEGNRVTAVTTKDRNGGSHTHRGRVIVDATYEGDVAAFAGVPFHVGREARSAEEPHAGEIFTDAFCEGAYLLSGAILPGGSGKADGKIMAYNYRFLVKDYGTPVGEHRLKSPPPGYNPLRYKWNPELKPYLPNRKMDVLGINWGNDWAGPNYAYPTASWEQRSKIAEQYRNYALGYLYYIQNEGGSPNLGLADDEFKDNGNFPYKLYVREARRIEGLYLLTESDMHKDLRGNGLRGPLHRDSIAIGLYEMDSHNVQNPADRSSRCSGEGAINLVDVTGPYQIPYGVMVPRNRDGLLAPVAISATHVALSSVRMEPVWSALGQAAGEAAVQALESGKELKDVNVHAIQQALLKQGAKLFFYQDVDVHTSDFADIQWMSLMGAVDGDENYRFHPETPIEKGELARLIVTGLDMPLSITAAHFKDAPRGSPYFKFIETLYDASTESGKLFFPFEARDYLAYPATKDSMACAYPDQPVNTGMFARILTGSLHHKRMRGSLKNVERLKGLPTDITEESATAFLTALLPETAGRLNPKTLLLRQDACKYVAAVRKALDFH